MQLAYAPGVKISSPRHLRRKDRLDILVREAGSASALAVRVGTPKSHISAMQAGNRGVGDDLAAKLELKMGKPVGWMDADLLDYPGESEEAERITLLGADLADIRELNHERFEAIAGMIQQLATSLRTTDRLLRETHNVTGYVSAERAKDKLDKPKPGPAPKVAGEGGLLGGTDSGFGALDDATRPDPRAPAPRKVRR